MLKMMGLDFTYMIEQMQHAGFLILYLPVRNHI